MSTNKQITFAEVRMAAWMEYLVIWRHENGQMLSTLHPDLHARLEEAVRKVFYAGYAAGDGTRALERIRTGPSTLS